MEQSALTKKYNFKQKGYGNIKKCIEKGVYSAIAIGKISVFEKGFTHKK